MYNVFGFKKQKYTIPTQAPNNANISSTLSMFIVIDLIEPNILYSNGKVKFVQYVRAIPMYRNQISSRIVMEDNEIKYTTKVQNDIEYVNTTGDTLTGDLNLNENKIILKGSKAEIQHAQGDDFDGTVFRNSHGFAFIDFQNSTFIFSYFKYFCK